MEISGSPKQKYISTSLVERQNLNFRMGVKRYTRLANSFSKKLENHVYHTALFVTYHNWIRIHTTTKVTPAMAAWLTQELYDVKWLAEMVEADQPKPQKPGPAKGTKYRPRRR